jgi:hypothetical protein
MTHQGMTCRMIYFFSSFISFIYLSYSVLSPILLLISVEVYTRLYWAGLHRHICVFTLRSNFFFNSHSGGWSPSWVHSARRPLNGLLYLPRWLWWWRIWWNEDWRGKPKYSEKTCPSATLSTTNLTWPDLGSNPGLRGGKPATNRMARPCLEK